MAEENAPATPFVDVPGPVSDDQRMETILRTEPDQLKDEDREFLSSRKDDLTMEEMSRYGIEGDELDLSDEKDKKPTPPPSEPKPDEKPAETPPKVEVKVRGEAPNTDSPPPVVPTETPKPEAKPSDPKDLTDDSKTAVDKYMQNHPTLKKIEQWETEKEVDELIGDRPEFKPHKDSIKTYMQHPAYKNVPAEIIAKALAYDDAIKIGAQKSKEADVKAEESSQPGRTVRQAPVKVDFQSMPKDQFEKVVNDVRMGKKIKVPQSA